LKKICLAKQIEKFTRAAQQEVIIQKNFAYILNVEIHCLLY